MWCQIAFRLTVFLSYLVSYSLSSEPTPASPLLLCSLLSCVVFEALFDCVTLLAQLEGQRVSSIVLSNFSLARHSSVTLTILSLSFVITKSTKLILLVRGRVHSDVLGYELISSEVIHEVLGSYGEAAFLVTIFLKNLIKALYHSLHHFFEASVH